MFQAFSLGTEENKKTANKNVKNDFYKNGYKRRNYTCKTAKIHRFVRFVMYCIITTVPVECYWHCSDGTVHYKSDKVVNFCGFTCVITIVGLDGSQL